MIMQNICEFIEFDKQNENEIQISAFVYETKAEMNQRANSLYRINLAVSGSATIRISDKEFEVKKGDVYMIRAARRC